jgi:hypothetical protein
MSTSVIYENHLCFDGIMKFSFQNVQFWENFFKSVKSFCIISAYKIAKKCKRNSIYYTGKTKNGRCRIIPFLKIKVGV